MISLDVHNISKKYNRKTVFDGLSFSHSQGVLGIAGSNGSGKSTLLRCLAGLARPSEGAYEWKLNDQLLSKEELKPLISYAAPYINLYGELTAIENLEFVQKVRGRLNTGSSFDQILEFVQMKEFGTHLFKNLSTGQQQRIKLASALISSSEILFLDELSSNFDDKGKALATEIVSIEKQKGTFIVLASNDPDEIALCDNVIILSSER